MRKWLLVVLAVFLTMSLALVGCGGTSEPTNSDGEGNAPQDQNQENTGSETGGEGAEGGTLIFGRGADSKSLDPSLVTDGESLGVTKNIFDTLLDYKGQTTEVEPALATEWKSSDDGLTWTFQLREGVKFHDGTDFNAEAVVFNFERWMDPDHPFHQGEFPYYGYMFGGYKGDEGHVIEAVKAVGEYTVEFKLKRPLGPFLNNLAMTPFAIASPEAIKKYGEEFGQNPVGTGPYVFEEWKKNDTITLLKNEDYWMEGAPKLDRLIFKTIPDNSARLTALQSGEIDLMDGLNPDDVAVVESDGALQLFKRPSMNVGYLALNTEKAPLDNVKVRQAINHAINKQALIDAFFGGLGEPAKNPMPPSLWGYNDDIKDYEYNPERAKELLAEAGYPDGFEIELWTFPNPRPYIPQPQKIAEAVQADLGRVGIKVTITSHEWAPYLDKTGKGEHKMAFLGWTGDNGDPDNFLYVLLDKDNAKGPDAGNIAFYKSDELHDILIEAQQLSDQAQRAQLYMKAQEIIKEDAPWVPLVHSTPPLAGIKEIKGFEPHPTGSDKFTHVSVQ